MPRALGERASETIQRPDQHPSAQFMLQWESRHSCGSGLLVPAHSASAEFLNSAVLMHSGSPTSLVLAWWQCQPDQWGGG